MRALPVGQLPDEVPIQVARARREIATVKARLRGWGETVDDQPADAEWVRGAMEKHVRELEVQDMYRTSK